MNPDEMTPEQVNVAIAELCGWTSRKVGDPQIEFVSTWWKNLEGREPCPLPNYHGSLAAMAQARATLSEDERALFVNYLCYSTPLRGYPVGFGDMFALVDATAAQQAVAFLRVKGGAE